jgi:hypothetical protein
MSGRFVAISASFSVRFLHLEFVSESVERSEFLNFDKSTGHVKKTYQWWNLRNTVVERFCRAHKLKKILGF